MTVRKQTASAKSFVRREQDMLSSFLLANEILLSDGRSERSCAKSTMDKKERPNVAFLLCFGWWTFLSLVAAKTEVRLRVRRSSHRINCQSKRASLAAGFEKTTLNPAGVFSVTASWVIQLGC